MEASEYATMKRFKEIVSVAIKRRWELDTIEFDNPLLLCAAADPRFLALKGVPTTVKDEVVEKMISSCSRVNLQAYPSSPHSPTKQKSQIKYLTCLFFQGRGKVGSFAQAIWNAKALFKQYYVAATRPRILME